MSIHSPFQAVYDPHHFFPGKYMMWFNSAMMKEIISAYKLVPATITAGPAATVGAVAEHVATGAAMELKGTHGGILASHLHFNDQIYMLNDRQWAEISKRLLTDVKAKLAQVKEIGFEEGVTLGSMFEG